jgi:Protein of unknown function (DUF1592)
MMLLWLGCATEEPGDGLTLLSPREQLIRVSMDLRGVHPSETELATIDANPDLYADFVDRYLEDERFYDRVEEIWNLRFLTRTGETYVDMDGAGLDQVSEARIAASMADEPLRLVRHIAEKDLPYSELVTADYTIADEVLAAAYNLDRDPGEGWTSAHYRDGRLHAGVLTMTTTWLRYPSMGGNANRHRANAVSKTLLCDDYLQRPIVLSRANIDQLVEDPEVAILSEGCQSCHASLDPLAAHFFGFFHEDGVEDRASAISYFPEREEGWRDYADKAPGYYGRPTANLQELGDAIAADPRFSECGARTAWEGLLQKDYTESDWADLQGAASAFAESDLRLKPLFRHIVNARSYRAAEDESGRVATVRTASPAQLASTIEALTEVRWSSGGVDALTDPTQGLSVLAGGVDGGFVTKANWEPSVGSVFVLERLAQAAGKEVAAHDLDPERQGKARMLAYVSVDDRPDTAQERFDAQIRALYLQVTGLPLGEDATEPEALRTLWSEVYGVEGSAEGAWAAVISVVLRDPRVLFY